MAYFEEGSEAMQALETMVDRVGVRNVLWALEKIANMKADHIREKWQDDSLARAWERCGVSLDRAARAKELIDGQEGATRQSRPVRT
jgi:hypothetical protein